MKKLLLLLALLPFASFAQDDYRPLVEKGKKWTYHHDTYQYVYDYYYMLDGDTVVAGKDCLKMCSENKDNTGAVAYEGALYEENRKVYCFYPEKDKAKLLYDFGCEVGDTVSNICGSLVVTDVQSIEEENVKLKKFTLKPVDPNTDMLPFDWIEGVGAAKDFFNMMFLWGNYDSLIACEVDGKLFYQHTTSIQGVEGFMPDGNDGIYDLQGRRLKTAPTRGIYIQNGKKRISH